HNRIAIAFLAAASWCKIEYAAGAALIVVVLAIARRLRLSEAIAYGVTMLVTALVALAYFGPALRDNVFAPSLTQGEIARHFFRNISGFAEWPRHLAIAVASAAAVALIGWLLWLRSKLAIPAMIIAALIFNSDSFFRGWALLQFVALIAGLRIRSSPLILFAAFSVASTVRVALNVAPGWYGCALVVPVYALAAYVLFVDERMRSNWWMLIVAAICIRDLAEQRERFAMKVFPIYSSRGVLYDASGDRARILNEFIRSVRGPTLAVLPEGVSLNYLTRTKTPLTFYMFTPPETAESAIEEKVIEEFQARRPVEVALVSRNVREYGFRAFGADYDRRLLTYLLQNYEVSRSWRAPRFQCLLLRNARR
ncbi:MAG: hypothetical protein QOE68_253, partial [Thermoanaerobaculia bacterium]|nr:hypothetical protein [Thermoanaerobaculia bacterium]